MAQQEESMGKPPEKYVGDEIEEIIIDGGKQVFREVKILLKNGTHITLNARLDIDVYSIIPQIIAIRGMRGRGSK